MSPTLLVTDDSMIIREMIKDVALDNGWEVVGEAANGQEAIDRFSQLRPDVVTLDLVMPMFDGLHALRGIRQLDPSACIVIVSAIDQKEVWEEALRLGAASLVVKPFKSRSLPASIACVVRKPTPHSVLGVAECPEPAMKATNALPGDNQILLESGTNEVEVLVFRVGGLTLGINVAKVREVLKQQDVVALPEAHSSLMGCFRLRDSAAPCVSLHRHLSEAALCSERDRIIILTEFNQQQIGFVVDMVERIHRISWTQVLPMPQLFCNTGSPITAIANIDARMVLMLDFEMIADQVANRQAKFKAVANPHGVNRGEMHLLVADDSATARHAVEGTLHGSGYSNVTVFENGALLWKYLTEQLDGGHAAADLVISDVEMPQIDGLNLTRRIKEHPQLNKVPVLLYSSILTPDNFKKGQAVGADAQLTKPELHRVVDVADELIIKSGRHADNKRSRHSEAVGIAV